MKLSFKINIKVCFLLISFAIFHLLLVYWINSYFRFTFSKTGGLKIVKAGGKGSSLLVFFGRGVFLLEGCQYHTVCHAMTIKHGCFLPKVMKNSKLISSNVITPQLTKTQNLTKLKNKKSYEKPAANPVKKELHYFAEYV